MSEPLFTVDQIEGYLTGWLCSPPDSVEARAAIRNGLSQLRCDQDGIEATQSREQEATSPTPIVDALAEKATWGHVYISKGRIIEADDARKIERELAELKHHIDLCHDALGEDRESDSSELWKFFETHKQVIERLRLREIELTEVRKHLVDANRGAERNMHMANMLIADNEKLKRELAESNERIAELKQDREILHQDCERWREHAKREREQRDEWESECKASQDQAERSLAIAEKCKEQRDRLAGTLGKFRGQVDNEGSEDTAEEALAAVEGGDK